MKPERVQFRQRVIAAARSVASWLCGLLGRIETVVGALKRAFGCGGNGKS